MHKSPAILRGTLNLILKLNQTVPVNTGRGEAHEKQKEFKGNPPDRYRQVVVDRILVIMKRALMFFESQPVETGRHL